MPSLTTRGGVGKSTITLLVADFFGSTSVTIADRRARILVLDLDAQNSCATALLGLKKVSDAQADERTIDRLIDRLARNEKPSLDDYLLRRIPSPNVQRKIPLGEVAVMPTSGDLALEVEERLRDRISIIMQERLRPMLEKAFDIVLVDLPANVDRRNFLPMAALGTSDFILTPTEPSKITVNALEKTFSIIRDAQGAARQAGHKAPKVVGVLLNKTDRRTKQYRLHADEIRVQAGKNKSLVFTNFLPSAPALATAADDSLEFETLRERYDTYYDHVRKVAKELAERCGLVGKKSGTKPRSKP